MLTNFKCVARRRRRKQETSGAYFVPFSDHRHLFLSMKNGFYYVHLYVIFLTSVNSIYPLKETSSYASDHRILEEYIRFYNPN